MKSEKKVSTRAKSKNSGDIQSLTQKELANCFSDLLAKEPFYAHVGILLPRIVSDIVPTAAVGKANGSPLSLFVNPNFFLNELASRKERVAVLKHELLHIVFRHVLRLEASDKDPTIFNYAADLVVNQFVEPWPLPDSAVTLEWIQKVKGIRLKSNQSLEYYYEKLEEPFQEGELDNNQGMHSFHELWGDETTKTNSNQMSSNDPISKNHANANGNRGELEREISRTLERAMQKSPDGWNKLPDDLKRIVTHSIHLGKSEKNWKNLLRIFMSSNGRTRIRYTMKKISKRYGTRPGIKVQRLKHILVAIDTSGSIDESLVAEFFKEIKGIWKTGAQVTVVECDAEVQNVFEYKGKTPEEFSGGGGTDFDPVFEWTNKNRRKLFDGMIYLTDGMADSPKVKPFCPVLWLIYAQNDSQIKDNFSFGRVVLTNP